MSSNLKILKQNRSNIHKLIFNFIILNSVLWIEVRRDRQSNANVGNLKECKPGEYGDAQWLI